MLTCDRRCKLLFLKDDKRWHSCYLNVVFLAVLRVSKMETTTLAAWKIKPRGWQVNKMFFSCFATHSPGLFRRCSLSMFDTTKGERKRKKSEKDWDKQHREQWGWGWVGNLNTERSSVGNRQKYWKSKRDALFWIEKGTEEQLLGRIHCILVLHHWTNTLASEDRHKIDSGVSRGYSFIPSLSILSTASLTRRMTVTMEAGQNTEGEKNSNSVSAVMNRGEISWAGCDWDEMGNVCEHVCVHTCQGEWRHVSPANTFVCSWCVCVCVCLCVCVLQGSGRDVRTPFSAATIIAQGTKHLHGFLMWETHTHTQTGSLGYMASNLLILS